MIYFICTTIILIMSYIDIHSHLLPGIDDGKMSFFNIKKMLKAYRDNDFSAIVFTPHYNNPYVDTKYDKIEKTFAKVTKIANKLNIDTYLACEYYIRDDSKIEYRTLLDKYVLVETSTKQMPDCFLSTLQEINDKGYTIFFAHIERFKWMDEAFARMLKENYKIILTTNAKGVGDLKRKYDTSLVDIITSDNHGDFKLPELLVKKLMENEDICENYFNFLNNF